MELRHMRYVLAVAEHHNFGRAAASLGIRQPPLSQQIKALETELGVRLFIRSRDGSELTAAGEVFAEHARAALACAEAARTEAQRADRGDTGRLIIGFLPSAFDVLLPKILMAFTRRWPHVTLEPVEFLQTGDQVEALRRGAVDLAVGRPPVASFGPDDDLSALPLTSDLINVVMPLGHALARRSRVEPASLAAERFILTPLEERFPRYWQLVCAAAGFTPRVASRVQGVHTVIGLVAAGVGLGVVPGSAKGSARTDVSFVPLSPPVAAPPLALLWRSADGRPLRRRLVAVTRDVLHLGADEMTARTLDQVFLTALREQVSQVEALTAGRRSVSSPGPSAR